MIQAGTRIDARPHIQAEASDSLVLIQAGTRIDARPHIQAEASDSLVLIEAGSFYRSFTVTSCTIFANIQFYRMAET